MVKVPVSDKTFKRPYSYRVIELSTTTSTFAGMMAYATAYRRKRISFSDCFDRLQIFTSHNMSDIFRNVNSYRTSMLARRYHQRITNSSRTLLLPYMSFVFIPEIINCCKDRIRTCLTQAT